MNTLWYMKYDGWACFNKTAPKNLCHFEFRKFMLKKSSIILFSLLSISLSSCALLQALKIIHSNEITSLHFETSKGQSNYTFVYPDTSGNAFLKELRESYSLTDLVRNAKSDKEKALILMNWTHEQWTHSGYNEPSKSDALTILREAKAGKNFRCVEYGIVLSKALQSVGIQSRVLALKTRDADVVESGAGHVLVEVWLRDFHKWVLADAQFNMMPELEAIPLNAVELQRAIVENRQFTFINLQGIATENDRKIYREFIPPYLYYFDVPFDNRPVNNEERVKVNGKTHLMLIPIGASRLSTFQRKFVINYVEYTNSLGDFYAVPH